MDTGQERKGLERKAHRGAYLRPEDLESKARPPDFLGGMRHKKDPNSKFKDPNTKNAITNYEYANCEYGSGV